MNDRINNQIMFRMNNKHPVLLSFIQCLFVFFVFFSINKFHIVYAGANDDFLVALLLSHDDIAIPFMSVFVTAPISWLQGITDSINVHIIFMIIMSFLSIVTANYILIKKSDYGFIVAFVLDLILIPTTMIMIQFTHTSALCCSVGVLLLISFLSEKKTFSKNTILLCLSAVFIYYGSGLRIQPYKIACIFGVIFLFSIVVELIIKLKQSVNASVKTLLINYGFRFIVVIVIILSAFGLHYLSGYVKSNLDGYNEMSKYSTARALVSDYQIATYKGNEVFYNGVGIVSQNDIDLLRNAYCNHYILDTDQLIKISEYSINHANSATGNKLSFDLIFEKLSMTVEKYHISRYFALCLMGVFLFSIVLLNVVFRRKKYIELITLLVIWGLTGIYILIKKPSYYYLLFPLVAVSIVICIFCKKTNRNIALLNSSLSIIFYIYLQFTRVNLRSVLAIVLSAICFMLVSFEIDINLLPELMRQPKRLLSVLVSVLLVFTFILSDAWLVKKELTNMNKDVDYELTDYVIQHSDQVFVSRTWGAETLFINYSNPLRVPAYYNNVIRTGGWDSKSHTTLAQWKKNNSKDIYKDAVNSNFRFVFNIDYSDYAKKIELFFNEHYAPEGKTIKMQIDKEFDNYTIYKAVTE